MRGGDGERVWGWEMGIKNWELEAWGYPEICVKNQRCAWGDLRDFAENQRFLRFRGFWGDLWFGGIPKNGRCKSVNDQEHTDLAKTCF